MLLAASLSAQQSSPAPSPQTQAPAPAQQPAPAQHGFRITGIVVDYVTGQPINQASVAIAPLSHGEERDISKSVVTGADGRFSFAGLSQGKYSLNGRARGYSFQPFDRHDEYSTAIAVGPDLDSEHLMFRLQPDAAIDGQVTDENNDPVQYAMVRLFSIKSRDGVYSPNAPIDQNQTDDQGHFHFGHLEPGSYYVAVSARPWYAQNVRAANAYNPQNGQVTLSPGPQAQTTPDDAALDVTFPLTFYPDATSSADATPLQLAPGARETANIVLRAIPSLHLRIHTGGSAQNATLGRMIFPRVSQRIFGDYLDSVYNAPDSWVAPGVIEISGLAPGRYVVELPPSTGPVKGVSRAWYREVDVSTDVDINAADSPGFASVNGTILFENSAVPKGAAIQLLNPDTGESFRSDISSKGEFDFPADNVKAGRYLLVLGGGHGFFVKKVVATGAKVTGRVVEIAPGASVHLAAIAASGAAQVDGKAVNDDRPFAGAMILLVPQDPANNSPLFRRDQSDSDGTFSLLDVVPGTYTVVAIAHGWDLEWSNPTVIQPYLKRGETVQVAAGGKLQVKVQVQ
jgi:5-hydroxyisourate hydrolase-like protein (transthyretin family)